MEKSNPALTKQELIPLLQELPYDALLEAYLHAKENGVITDELSDAEVVCDDYKKRTKSKATLRKSKHSTSKQKVFQLEEVEQSRISPFLYVWWNI